MAHSLTKIERKDLAIKLANFYSAPLAEEVGADGSVRHKVSGRSSSLTPEYVVALKRHVKQIERVPEELEALIREDNGVAIWEDLHLVPSAMINEPISKTVSGLAQDRKSGQAGNLSLAYLTPRLSPLAVAGVRALGMGPDCKLLSSFQVELLRKTEPTILFEDPESGDAFGLPTGELDAEEVEARVQEACASGLRPIRVLLDGMSPALSALFNMKPINVIARKELEREAKRYFESRVRSGRVEAFSAPELAAQFGVNIGSALESRVSNHRFWAVVEPDGSLREIHLIRSQGVYFGYHAQPQRKPEFNATSFATKSLSLKSSVMSVAATEKATGKGYDVPINELDMEDVFLYNDWEGLRSKNARRPAGAKIRFGDYLFHKRKPAFKAVLEELQAVSTSWADSQEDEQILKELLALDKAGALVSMAKVQRPPFNLVDHALSFRGKEESGVEVVYHERGSKAPRSNAPGDFRFIFLRKENLAFEREKALSALFAAKRVQELVAEGHTKIKLVFEKPVPREDGTTGFLDLAVLSTDPQGRRRATCHEFKAHARVGKRELEAMREQAAGYRPVDFLAREGAQLAHEGALALGLVAAQNLHVRDFADFGRAVAAGSWPKVGRAQEADPGGGRAMAAISCGFNLRQDRAWTRLAAQISATAPAGRDPQTDYGAPWRGGHAKAKVDPSSPWRVGQAKQADLWEGTSFAPAEPGAPAPKAAKGKGRAKKSGAPARGSRSRSQAQAFKAREASKALASGEASPGAVEALAGHLERSVSEIARGTADALAMTVMLESAKPADPQASLFADEAECAKAASRPGR